MSYSLRVRCTGWPRLVTLRRAGVEADFADLDGSVFSARRARARGDGGADARDQFANAEGLGDVVVGAEFERLHLFFFAFANGDHQNRQAGSKSADAAQGLNAADAGHVDVEQDHVDVAGVQQLQRFFAARRFSDLKAEFNERRAQGSADGRFVVDDKNANGRLVHDDFLFCTGAGIAAKNVVPSSSSLVTQT